jgi:uncharacterized RDD family membrane protein YckC
MQSSADNNAPSLFRILAAIFYDTLLLIAILFVATAIVLILNGGKQISQDNYLYTAFLFSLCFIFYYWFWMHGGQTLGMRSWRIRLTQEDSSPITRKQAAIRFFSALLSWSAAGLGFFWILIDEKKRSWHDRLSGTKLILMQKP